MAKSSITFHSTLAVLNLACASGAMAEQTPTVMAPAQVSVQNEVIQEVIVTSQRRAVKVQDIAIAETVLTGDQLKDKAIVRLADLQSASPALVIADAGLSASVNIRGIGLASGSPQVANGVATYIDGLFQPPIVTTASFYDLANIEILRGPQGTLVGSNSTGGAVLITSQNPKLGAIEGYAELGAGNFDTRSFQGAVNVPVSDTLAVRLAANHRAHDSYYTDRGPYRNEPGMLDENAARIGVLWKPGRFQALLKLDALQKKTGGAAYKPIRGSANDVGVSGGAFDLNYNSPTKFDERALMTGLELRYETAGGIVLRSLSGAQNKKVNGWWDLDATTSAASFQDQYVRERQYTQELNIISPTTGRFNWILGAYYQDNRVDVANLQTGGGLPVNIVVDNKKRTLGLFAQTGYYLVDNLELQFGLRASRFDASGVGGVVIGRGLPGFPPNGLMVADLAGQYDDAEPTGKLSLNWKADKANLVYGFVARGYKPGNYNSLHSKFKQETVLNYELGWKSTMAGGLIKTQLDVFYNNYKNLQLDVLDLSTGQRAPDNLPSSHIKGIEGQLQARLIGFRVDAGFAYVDSKLGATALTDIIALPGTTLGPQCPMGVPSNPPACFNYTPFIYANQGGPNLFSPKLTYNLGVDYKFELPNEMSLTPRVNLSHVDGSYYYATYRANAYMPGYTTLSALLTLRREDWTVELHGSNLTNKKYIVGTSNNNLFTSVPREFGLRVSRDF